MLSENIKKYRLQSGTTQKDLADLLHVTPQAVSRWELGDVEPSVDTLSNLAQIFGITMDELISGKKVDIPNRKEEKEKSEPEIVCKDCGKKIAANEPIYTALRKINGSSITETVNICSKCLERHKQLDLEKKNLDRERQTSTEDDSFLFDFGFGKSLAIATTSGIIAAIASAIFLLINDLTSIGASIGIGILIGYVFISTVYCIFSGSYIAEVFVAIASWSLKLPGIIFSFDLDGLLFLIAIKILFWIIGIVVGILMFIIAFTISGILSVFTFPVLVTKKIINSSTNKKEIKENV